ncbi:MAG: M20 family metallopeptidase [Planctomycetaceae bacterium]|nr:M20 family metallopeptidase [Planctomycetaceae bacterium]
MALDLVTTLSDLISLPSVNPMGRDLKGPEFLEYRVTEYLEAFFRQLGVDYVRQTVEPQRDNIIARIDGRVPPDAGGQVLLFEAHQDTVPVDGMTIPPWTPLVRDGRIYGRGSCDIKGGMTAMLGAFARLAAERPDGMPTLIMACTVNEEHGYTGATALTELWTTSAWKALAGFIPRVPDAGVIAEPTRLNVVVAHKGTVRWRAQTRGKAVHSSQPHLGDNAIYKMARLLAALEAYQRDAAPRLPQHSLCGQVTLSVGTIRGGISVNTVPDRCTIEIDRRILPGETRASAYRHVIDFVANYPGIDFEIQHDAPFLEGEPLADGANAAVANRLGAISRELSGQGERIGVPFGTDAAQIAASGVPSVVFGPGSIDQAHTADEWLPLDELELASEALYRLGRDGL